MGSFDLQHRTRIGAMNPTPILTPTPNRGIQQGVGVGFMEREHLQNFDVSWGHEPGSSTAVRAAAPHDRTVL